MGKGEKRGDYARNMYTDWTLPSTTKEKRLFSSVDGRDSETAGEIKLQRRQTITLWWQ